MGRVKLKVRKLESVSARQVTYSKRKVGLAKKVMELSILCGIDIALLMFSTTGKPTLCTGVNNDLTGILERLSYMSPQERLKRKLDILEILKKAIRKSDKTADVDKLLDEGEQKVEELKSQLMGMQAILHDKNDRLSHWTKPENIGDLTHIRAMEEDIVRSLNHLHSQKVYLEGQEMQQNSYDPQEPALSCLPEQQFAYDTLPLVCIPNLATAQSDFSYYGNASRPIENNDQNLNIGFQYPYQQGDYNYNLVGVEDFKQGMDINMKNPYFTQVQQLNPVDVRTSYEAPPHFHCNI